MTKEKVTELLSQMPDKFQLEELLDRILLLSKIEKGIEQSEEGRVLTHAEAEIRLKKWLS